MPYANSSNNKHIPQHEHAYVSATADDRILRPTPTTAGSSHLMAPHYRGSNNIPPMVPTPMPQGPPMIHRGHQIPPPGAGAIFTVYMPAAVHRPSHHHTATSPVSHHTVAHPAHPTSRTIAFPTTVASSMPHSVHMVPACTNVEESRQATSNLMVTSLPLSTSSHSGSSKMYATPEHSNGASSDEETATTTKQDNRATTGSFDSQQAVPHSVLLLAAKKHGKRKDTDSPTAPEEAENAESSTVNNKSTATSSTVPLKKRKMVSKILRTKQPKHEEGSSFHVSPVSHGSKTTGATSWSPDRSQVSHGSSYDDLMKGGQVLPENAKITKDNTIAIASIAPPQTVTTVRHFPTQLYDLLLDSSPPTFASAPSLSQEDESVLQWCSHGKAWRIVRWDALRKSVLPEYFGGVSVDLFLSEIAAWGFTEITSGTDVGAYQHTLFRRGFPNLCKEIRRLRETNPATGGDSGGSCDQDEEDNQVRAQSSTPSILQVPSLGDAGTPNATSNEREERETQEPKSGGTAKSGIARSTTTSSKKAELSPTTTAPGPSEATSPPSGSMWPLHPQPPVYIPYREQEDHFMEHQMHHPQYQHGPSFPAPFQYMQGTWVPVSGTQTTDPSGAGASAVTSASSMPSYSPVQVRSGRGAARRPVRVPARHMQPNPVTVTPNSAMTRRVVAPHSSRTSGTNSYRVVSNRGRRTGSVSLMGASSSAPSRRASKSSVSSYGESTFASSSGAVTSSAPHTPTTVADSPLRPAQQEQQSPGGVSAPTTPAWKQGSPVVASSPPVTTSSAMEQHPPSPPCSLGGRPFPSLVTSASSPNPEATTATP